MALKHRDFRKATQNLPVIIPDKFDTVAAVAACALPVLTYRGEYVTMGSLAKLKLALWEDEGLIGTETHRTVDCRTYANGMARARELEALGCYNPWGMG